MAEGRAALAARLEEDMKAALRSGEKLRLGVIRRARAAVQNAEIAARGAALTDEQVERVLRGIVKQHSESIEQFTAAGREDRVAQERAEMAILEGYLPARMDPAAVEEVVRAVVADTGAAGPQDLGRVMREAMSRLGGAADGKDVNAAARRLLHAGG